MKPNHKFLVCVNSDGCVFDNMDLKHKECFCPATVNVWELQSVSRYARQSAEFVNLYSKTCGMNRFPALVRTLELLAQRPEAAKANNAQFYPIIPGDEVNSWKKLKEVVSEQFKNGTYKGAPMQEALDAFDSVLQENPNW